MVLTGMAVPSTGDRRNDADVSDKHHPEIFVTRVISSNGLSS
jgi:hypothetical protein